MRLCGVAVGAAGVSETVRGGRPPPIDRDVAIDLFEAEPALLVGRPGQTIIADKGYASREFER